MYSQEFWIELTPPESYLLIVFFLNKVYMEQVGLKMNAT